MRSPVSLSPEVATKAIRAAYQLKLIGDDVLTVAKGLPNQLANQTIVHGLLDAQMLDANKITKVIGKIYQLNTVVFKESDLDPRAIRKLPKAFILQHQIIPLSLEDKVLRVATADPTKARLQGQIAEIAGCDVVMSLAPIPVIAEALDANLIVNAIDAPKKTKKEEQQEEEAEEEARVKEAGSGSWNAGFPLRRKYKIDDGEAVVEYVQDILTDAIEYDVSDIHIEPYRRTARMRWRLDGVMQEQKQYQPFLVPNYAAVMARLKLMAGCDISERRLPQDGAITISHEGEEVDFRFNIVPTKYGERRTA